MTSFCRNIFFGSFTLITAFTGCAVEKTKYGISIYKKSNEKITAEGYSILKNGKFKLKNKFQLTDTSILSPSKIYEVACYDEQWFKFFENGRVLHCLIHRDSNQVLVKPIYECGYYYLKNNDIKIELSQMATFAFGDSYDRLVITGKIVGDTIKFYKDQWGGSGRNIGYYGGLKGKNGQECFYIKTDKFFITKAPSW